MPHTLRQSLDERSATTYRLRSRSPAGKTHRSALARARHRGHQVPLRPDTSFGTARPRLLGEPSRTIRTASRCEHVSTHQPTTGMHKRREGTVERQPPGETKEADRIVPR